MFFGGRLVALDSSDTIKLFKDIILTLPKISLTPQQMNI